DSLACDAECVADLFECEGGLVLVETVVQREDLSFAGREVATEELVEKVTAEHLVGAGLDLVRVVKRQSLAECRRTLVAGIDRRVERYLGHEESPGTTDLLHRLDECGGEFLVGGRAPKLLCQQALRPCEAHCGAVLVERKPHRASLL